MGVLISRKTSLVSVLVTSVLKNKKIYDCIIHVDLRFPMLFFADVRVLKK